MIARPQRKSQKRLAYFEQSGIDKKHYQLIIAAYNNNTERAKQILLAEPEQVRRQDPYAGLTALHIAIFRQNDELVSLLVRHPLADLTLKDVFQRSVVDMLGYTTSQTIFEAVIASVYPDQMRALQDETYERGLRSGTVVPLKPRDKA